MSAFQQRVMTMSNNSRYSFWMKNMGPQIRWGSLSFRQVRALTVANLKTRYRKTAAGFLWVLLNPLIMFGIQSLIFSNVLKITMTNYTVFLLSGLLPWIFISQTLEMCTSIFVSSGRLLKSYSLHPLVYLSAQVLDNVINFSVSILIMLSFCITILPQPLYLLMVPIPIFCLFLGTFGLAWLVATTHVFFRDTKFIISFVLQIFFFITPIFYPSHLLPEYLFWLKDLNPINYLIQPFRSLIYQPNLEVFAKDCLWSLAVSVVIFLFATVVWGKRRNELYFHL